MKDARDGQRVAEGKLNKTSESIKELEAEISKISLELRPEEKLKYAPSSSSSSSAKTSASKLEKTLAELTRKKNGLSFDPVKVAMYKDLDDQMNKLLKEKAEGKKKKDKFIELLEVSSAPRTLFRSVSLTPVISQVIHLFVRPILIPLLVLIVSF